jgi:type II secretory pathway component PulM
MKLSLPSLPPSLSGSIADRIAALTDRERLFLLVGAAAAVLTLIFGLILPLDRSVTQAQERVSRKQADLQWMRQVAPELAGTAPPPASAQESLLVIVERSARESGLSTALAGTEPTGTTAINVRLEKASFDTLIAWLARLSQQNGIRVDNATIDGAGTPGLVNAAVLLRSS